MPRTKARREVRLGLNVTPAVQTRLAGVADVAGQSESVIASLAMVIGLRMLEQSILGIDAKTLADASGQLRTNIEQDVEALATAVDKPATGQRRIGFKGDLRGNDDEPAWVPVSGYMAGL